MLTPSDDHTWLIVGTGEPLVVLPGLARGPERRVLSYAPLARATGRQVHVFNRPSGLPRGISMSELARRQVATLTAKFADPVDLMGISTGGAIALQIAVDHPAVIKRLIIAASAGWLGDEGRQKLRAFATEVAAGRTGAAILSSVLFPPSRRWFMQPLLWLGSQFGRGDVPTDMLATIDAETAYDVTARLKTVAAPTLLIAGGRDAAFPLPLVEATADAIPNSRLVVYPRAGHLGTMMHPRFGSDIAAFLRPS